MWFSTDLSGWEQPLAFRVAVRAWPGPSAPGRSSRSAPWAGSCSPRISSWPFSPPGELGLISPLKADTAPPGPHERPQPLSANQRQAGPGGGGAGREKRGCAAASCPGLSGGDRPSRAVPNLTHRGSQGALGDLGARMRDGWCGEMGPDRSPAQEGRAPAIPRWERGWHRPSPLRVVLSGVPAGGIERGPCWRVPGQRQDKAAPSPAQPARPAAGAKPVSLALEQWQRLRLACGLSGEERNVCV